MQDPAQLFRFEADAGVEGTGAGRRADVLLVALAGFMDAGHTQRLLVEHLLDTLDHRVVATFDVDQLLDYRGRRPMMTFAADHWADYADPALVLYRVTDRQGRPFLVLSGPEPDYQWERTVEAIRLLMEAYEVDLTVAVHGIPMAVPHTRPTQTTFHGTSEDRRLAHRPLFGTVSVPASLASLLELRLDEAGEDAVGYAVHVPHYLAQSDYAPAALQGLAHFTEVTGLDIEAGDLEAAAQETMRVVQAELDGSSDAAEVVSQLEHQYDARQEAVGAPLAADGEDLPTADQIGAEFEAFLRDQEGGRP